MTAPPSFTCPQCGMTSYHPEDLRFGYCGNCHAFTGTGPQYAVTEPGRWSGMFFDLNGRQISIEAWERLARDKYEDQSESAWWRIGGDSIGELWISTVWLGTNTNVFGVPLIFETMVFYQGPDRAGEMSTGSPLDSLTRRYPTRQAALQGHGETVAVLSRLHDSGHADDLVDALQRILAEESDDAARWTPALLDDEQPTLTEKENPNG